MEEKLIDAVKSHEILYDKSLLLYRNKSKRAAAWSEISKELNLPEDVCQNRWRYLRDKYVKKTSECHHTSGNGAKSVEGQWRYQSQMEFLREHIKPRKSMTSLKQESSFTEIAEKHSSESVESIPEALFSEMKFLEDPLSSNSSTPSLLQAPTTSRKRSRRESDTKVFNAFLNKMTSIAEARFSRIEKDPHEGFFGMLREIFDKMDPEAVEDAKFSFLNYLHEQRKKSNC